MTMMINPMNRTQNKENFYYLFWIVAMVAFIVPQVYTAVAYTKLADLLQEPIKVEVIDNEFAEIR